MDDREKLIELLDAIQLRGEDFTDYEIYGMRLPNTVSNESVADRLIANGVTVQQWIPVSEPPTKEGWYHVAILDVKTGKYSVENDLYAIDIAKAHGHTPGFCKARRWKERERLTHWMPYPEPPKGE